MSLARASKGLGALLAVLVVAGVVHAALAHPALPDEVLLDFKIFGEHPVGKTWLVLGYVVMLLAAAGLFVHSARTVHRSQGRELGVPVPHADYWLDPERRAVTLAHLAGARYLMGCITCVGLGLMADASFEAQQQSPPRFPDAGPVLLVMLGTVSLLIWVSLRSRRRFDAVPPQERR